MKNQYESILGTDIWKYNKAVKDKSVGQEAIESVLRQIIQVKVIGKEALSRRCDLQRMKRKRQITGQRRCLIRFRRRTSRRRELN